MSSAALAAYRKARAVELALAGNSYDAIAHELGLANRGTDWLMVQNALKQRLFAAVDAHREAELERWSPRGTAAPAGWRPSGRGHSAEDHRPADAGARPGLRGNQIGIPRGNGGHKSRSCGCWGAQRGAM
jgi:hypothetical protein